MMQTAKQMRLAMALKEGFLDAYHLEAVILIGSLGGTMPTTSAT